jgi:hypothetical protein
MKGKMNAIGLTLLMIASALAGCTSGDPDGDGEMGIDSEMLDQLIQDNLQDFINNTTVIVNNIENNQINSSSESTTLLYTITGSETGDETVDFDAFNVGTEYVLELSQNSGEKLTFLGLYYTVGLQGTCKVNITDCQPWDSESWTYHYNYESDYVMYTHQGHTGQWDFVTISTFDCEDNISSRNSFDPASFFAPGLECEIDLTLGMDWNMPTWTGIPIYPDYLTQHENYDWEWSDITFYVHYSVESVNTTYL